MSSKSKAQSIRQKLTILSRDSGVTYENLETAFILERFVARLVSDERLSRILIFKGGFVSLRVYNSPRYTVDVDAITLHADIDSTLAVAAEKAQVDLDDGVWFRHERDNSVKAQGPYGGLRQTYRAGIGELPTDLRRSRIVNFDVGTGDPVTPAPRPAETQSMLSGFSSISWLVYPVETVLAEKLHALISHGDINSRAKDIYDIARFLPLADSTTLADALVRCFEFRRTTLPSSFPRALRNLDIRILKRGWPSAISSLPTNPSFESEFEKIIKLIEEIDGLL